MSSVEGPSQAHADAAEVAQGSGVVLGANLLNRAVRLVNNWFLAGALGPLAYGLYELARTVVDTRAVIVTRAAGSSTSS